MNCVVYFDQFEFNIFIIFYVLCCTLCTFGDKYTSFNLIRNMIIKKITKKQKQTGNNSKIRRIIFYNLLKKNFKGL